MTETKIEEQRKLWARIAKANDWYSESFYVQVWFSPAGDVVDSVSFRGLQEDIIIDCVEVDEELDFQEWRLAALSMA